MSDAKPPVLSEHQMETLANLLAFTNRHKPRTDWHEPDEQSIRARVLGSKLDNAWGDDPTRGELVLVLVAPRDKGEPAQVEVNIATLLALATYRDRE